MLTFEKYPESKLIGLSGTLCAGKDTAAKFLMERGFMHVSTGDVLRAEATSRGLGWDRPTLIELGVEIREKRGTLGALVQVAIEQWEEQRADFANGLVISGLRVVGECQELKGQRGMLVFVDAPIETRYQRQVARSRAAEGAMTFQQFVDHERIEFEGLGGPERPHLRAVRDMSHVVIQNAGTQEAFLQKLPEVLNLAA